MIEFCFGSSCVLTSQFKKLGLEKRDFLFILFRRQLFAWLARRQPFPWINGCAFGAGHFPDFEVQDGVGVGLAADLAEEGAAVDGLAFLDGTIAQVGVNGAVAAVGDDDAGACARQVEAA